MIAISGSIALAIKILTALSAAYSVDQLSGNRFSNFFGGKGFESRYDKDLRKYNEEVNKRRGETENTTTRSRSRGNFFNFNRNNQTTGAARRFSILSFLGDRSRKLDDAPDIVDENQSVLSGIKNFGFSGLLPQTTLVPEIDNSKILDTSFEGVRKEIERINRNINSIANAITAGAAIDRKYREQVIADMRKDLVEKGKDRSQTRSERSRFNLLTRPKQQFKETQKSLANNLSKALAVSLGAAELFDLGKNFFNQDNEKVDSDNGGGEDGNNTPPGSSSGDNPKVGDYYQSGTGKSKKYYVLEEDGSFRKTNVVPRSGEKYKKQDFNVVVEELKGANNTPPPPPKKVDGKEVSFVPFNYGGDNNFNNNTFNDGSLVSMNSNSYQPLSAEAETNIYDLRTNKGKVNLGESETIAGSGFDNEITDHDPSLFPSPWEAYSRSIG